MRVCTLASSSKGNCVLVFSKKTKILIDCGITLSELTAKLSALDILPSEISAILITHDHSDHIKGIGPLSRKYNTPIYCHQEAYDNIVKKLGRLNLNLIFRFGNVPFQIGEFDINSFQVPHDAPFCVGYSISQEEKKISIMTDIGAPSDEIIRNLFNSRLVILEANHDENMLMNNPNYSAFLKQRILSNHGHLSNTTTAKIIEKLCQNNVKQILLAHLSEENNTPELCFNTICSYLKSSGIVVGENIKIDIAHPRQISTVFHLK